jgi:hypothetical protein
MGSGRSDGQVIVGAADAIAAILRGGYRSRRIDAHDIENESGKHAGRHPRYRNQSRTRAGGLLRINLAPETATGTHFPMFLRTTFSLKGLLGPLAGRGGARRLHLPQ